MPWCGVWGLCEMTDWRGPTGDVCVVGPQDAARASSIRLQPEFSSCLSQILRVIDALQNRSGKQKKHMSESASHPGLNVTSPGGNANVTGHSPWGPLKTRGLFHSRPCL